MIVDIAVEHDLYLISDEVYENYVYDGLRHVSPASLEGMFDRTITLNAMSKLYSATGFRLGYVVAKKEIVDLMEKYLQYTVAGTNHFAQYGFIEALKMDTSFFNEIHKSFTKRRDFVYEQLNKNGFDVSILYPSLLLLEVIEQCVYIVLFRQLLFCDMRIKVAVRTFMQAPRGVDVETERDIMHNHIDYSSIVDGLC